MKAREICVRGLILHIYLIYEEFRLNWTPEKTTKTTNGTEEMHPNTYKPQVRKSV